LTTVIAWRRRIEERGKDPAEGASDDESQSIGEDVIQTRPPSADQASRNKTATDYCAFALLFFFFPQQAPRFPKFSVNEGAGLIENFLCSDPIHDRRSGERGDKKPASEIDVSASALSSAGRRWVWTFLLCFS
jgi:hypothetical protein